MIAERIGVAYQGLELTEQGNQNHAVAAPDELATASPPLAQRARQGGWTWFCCSSESLLLQDTHNLLAVFKLVTSEVNTHASLNFKWKSKNEYWVARRRIKKLVMKRGRFLYSYPKILNSHISALWVINTCKNWSLKHGWNLTFGVIRRMGRIHTIKREWVELKPLPCSLKTREQVSWPACELLWEMKDSDVDDDIGLAWE
jgi:hypothetical protein